MRWPRKSVLSFVYLRCANIVVKTIQDMPTWLREGRSCLYSDIYSYKLSFTNCTCSRTWKKGHHHTIRNNRVKGFYGSRERPVKNPVLTRKDALDWYGERSMIHFCSVCARYAHITIWYITVCPYMSRHAWREIISLSLIPLNSTSYLYEALSRATVKSSRCSTVYSVAYIIISDVHHTSMHYYAASIKVAKWRCLVLAV